MRLIAERCPRLVTLCYWLTRNGLRVKQTLDFVSGTESVACEVAPGRFVEIPVIPGILKHPTPDELPALLRMPRVARRYTAAAIEKCAWPILRQFPAGWLKECMPDARLKPPRKAAILFLLS